MISLLLETFSLRLFAAAHVAMLSISCWCMLALTDGTRYVSSANFTSELPGCNGFRSAAVTVYAAGPMPDPCTMLAEMLAVDDSSPLNIFKISIQNCRSSFTRYTVLQSHARPISVSHRYRQSVQCIHSRLNV